MSIKTNLVGFRTTNNDWSAKMCGTYRNTVSQSTLVQISSLISQEISRIWAVHKRRLLKAEGRGSKMLIYIVKRRKMVRERHKIR